MKHEPLRLLARSYGLSGAVAIAVAAVAGPIAALLVFWLGGALAALALSWARAAREPLAAEDAEDEVAASARRWTADRAAELDEQDARAAPAPPGASTR